MARTLKNKMRKNMTRTSKSSMKKNKSEALVFLSTKAGYDNLFIGLFGNYNDYTNVIHIMVDKMLDKLNKRTIYNRDPFLMTKEQWNKNKDGCINSGKNVYSFDVSKYFYVNICFPGFEHYENLYSSKMDSKIFSLENNKFSNFHE
jgi:hypothetical protein